MWTKLVSNQFAALGAINPILSWGGGIVALVWLLILGKWEIIVGGLLVMFLDTYFYSFIIFPIQLLLGGLAVLLSKIHSSLGFIVGVIGALFTNSFIVVWSFVFIGASVYLSISYDAPILPLILGGYTIATGLFTGMAQKEGAGLTISALQGVALSQTSYILLAILLFMGAFSWLVPVSIALAVLGTITQLMVHAETNQHGLE